MTTTASGCHFQEMSAGMDLKYVEELRLRKALQAAAKADSSVPALTTSVAATEPWATVKIIDAQHVFRLRLCAKQAFGPTALSGVQGCFAIHCASS